MKKHWLFKTDPELYSYQNLERDKKTVWQSVKNSVSLKKMKYIQKGDSIFIYHSGEEEQVVGIAKAVSNSYKNSGEANSSLVIDITHERTLKNPIPYWLIKNDAILKNSDLVIAPEIEICFLREEEAKHLLELAGEEINAA
jgi:predicted RNA-binding protein with PUA-like domain